MTETTDALVLDLVEWVARATTLFRSDRDVANLMPAADDPGRTQSIAAMSHASRSRAAWASWSPRAVRDSCASTAAAASAYHNRAWRSQAALTWESDLPTFMHPHPFAMPDALNDFRTVP